jgi:cell division protease FtsH
LIVSPWQSHDLAQEVVAKVPAAALAGLCAALMAATPDAARAADFVAPPEGSTTVVAEQSGPQSLTFGSGTAGQQAPALRDDAASGLPEGNQWRYSEFINAVQGGKVERVRFSKDGSMLQVRNGLFGCRSKGAAWLGVWQHSGV